LFKHIVSNAVRENPFATRLRIMDTRAEVGRRRPRFHAG
jgi:hypothetical protein